MIQQKGNATIWAIVGAVVLIVVIVGLAKIASREDDAATGVPTRTISRGAEGSAVVLTEYADFQCPACKTIAPLLETLYQEFGGEVRFVFRHFPLRQIHRNAEAAARAAEAAWRQDKFWEMQDKLYTGQEIWEKESSPQKTFEEYAQTLGLDLARFKADMSSREVKMAVNADAAMGRVLKIPGTPTFFLNDEKIEPSSLEEFRSLLRDALGKTVVVNSTSSASTIVVSASSSPVKQ